MTDRPDKTTAPYGSWKSPITAEVAAGASSRIGDVTLDGQDIYWVESRPKDAGRSVLVRHRNGRTEDITPEDFSVRSRVHEYGGGAYLAHRGTIFFANAADQKLYRQDVGHTPVALTPDGLRYADCLYDQTRNRLICVREDHRGDGEAVNTLVALDPARGGEGEILFEGTDFVASPRLSPDGARLAWLTWNHPNMPWDHTHLWLAELDESGHPVNPRKVPEPSPGAITQPRFSPDGALYFIADWSDWWNLYRLADQGAEPVYAMEAEFAGPQWVFGLSNYDFLCNTEAIVSYTQNSRWHLARLSLDDGGLTAIETDLTDIGHIRAEGNRAIFSGASETAGTGIYRLTDAIETIRAPALIAVSAADLAAGEIISFPTGDGETAYGIFYPPPNARFQGREGEAPPLLVKVHGGPTGSATPALDLRHQFWASCGIAILDLNHRGSTGYGRKFRHRLNSQWGVFDVADAVKGAAYLAEQGRVDGARLAISGGSAGGFTVLAALAFHNTFTAGASYYGVSDLEALARDTHKFESRYLDQLIGPYPAARAVYRERSPIHAIDRLDTPLIVFQGLKDPVVPPEQSEMIVEALRQKNIPVAYLTFETESHGFRDARNIARSLEAELYFYGKIFGFEPAGAIDPVRIENLDK